VTDHPTIKVTRDLRAIVDMTARLEAQAIAKANDALMPGGEAMVNLAYVADLSVWNRRVELAEQAGGVDLVDEDPDDLWPVFQRLRFWSEQWRSELGMDYGDDPRWRPTLATEAGFLANADVLAWIWDNELHFEAFADDVSTAHAQLENLLDEGRRAQHGVQCFDCSVDLVRPMRDRRVLRECEGHEGVCTWPHRFCGHDRGGLADEWLCPSCDRRYALEDYQRAVQYAHYAYADWLTIDEAAERTDCPASTIKVWALRGHVRKRRHDDSGRMTYNVSDVERRLAGGNGSDAVADEIAPV
jgi:hypothetical protein